MEAKIKVYGKAMNRTVLGIANAYLKLNPNTTLDELNRAFPIELNSSKRSDTIFVDVRDKDKFINDKGNSNFELFFFEKPDETLLLKDGTVVTMLELWVKADYEKMVEHSKKYGIVVSEMQATKPMEKGGFYLEILHPISVGGGFFSTLFKYWLIYAIIVAILGIIGYLTQCSEPAEPEKVELDQENFTFHNILFERDRSVILSGSESDLQEAYKILNDYPDISVIIVGHSSKDNETSNVEYNRKLSLERAEAVKQWLADKGISEDRMQSEGRGFDDPVASNETESGKKKNRRIEFVVK